MDRVFLSHSSVDADFVRLVKKSMGDAAILDEVDFDAGARIIDQIQHAIGDCKVFVAFLSDTALNSDWVQKELEIAIGYAESRNLIVDIFSLDKKVRYTDTRLPEKLRKDNIIRYIANVEIAVNRLMSDRRFYQVTHSPVQLALRQLFVGRNDEIRYFETDFSRLDEQVPTFAFASNYYKGMGRRRFLTFALRKLGLLKPNQTPVEISLRKGESVENFLMKLNSWVYNSTTAQADLNARTLQEKIHLAKETVLEYKRYSRIITIIDEGAIVLPNHEIVDWFYKLTQEPELHNNFTFCIISNWQPKHSYLDADNIGCAYPINELDPVDTRNLFINLLGIYGIKSLTAAQKQKFIDTLTGVPAQIIFTVQKIRAAGPTAALLQATEIQQHSDAYSAALIEEIKTNSLAFEMLHLLARESISTDIFTDVFGDTPQAKEALALLVDYSAVSFINGSVTNIQLNATIADYMMRRQWKIDSAYTHKLDSAIQRYLTQSLDILAQQDYSKFMLALAELVRKGGEIPQKYYIAPLLLDNIIREYNAGHYPQVEQFCTELLRKTNFDPQVIWELHYHLVRVYARTGNKKFWQALRESSLDYIDREFLTGFFYRNKKDQAEIRQALPHFENVLAQNPSHVRALREIANTYILLDDYDKALEYTRSNYEQYPSDILLLQSYFVALVRNKNFNPKFDYSIADRLLKEARESRDVRAADITRCMTGEYAYYVEGNFSKAIALLREAEQLNENRRFPLKAIYGIYFREKMFGQLNEIKAELDKI